MSVLALAVGAAMAVAVPPEREFWKPSHFQQVKVTAELLTVGDHLAVYRDLDYVPPGLSHNDTGDPLPQLVSTFDRIIYPQLSQLLGAVPDHDANNRVLLLLTDTSPEPALAWRFDLLDEKNAAELGLRTNSGEVIYHSFAYRGNRAVWNERELAAAFAALLQHEYDPKETAWTQLVGNYASFLSGLSGPRALWGDENRRTDNYALREPWQAYGWSMLLMHYLHERFPEAVPGALVHQPGVGLAGLAEALIDAAPNVDLLGSLTDGAMATWLDDPSLGDGRFDFLTVSPPRPVAAARVAASRPASGQVLVGSGGFGFIVVEGDGRRSLPLALQGERNVTWVARAVFRSPEGPDREIPVAFRPDLSAQVSLPPLAQGESVVLVVAPFPQPTATFDFRPTTLHWGIGWVPTLPEDHAARALDDLADRAMPDVAETILARVGGTLERLAGLSPDRLESRFDWAPSSRKVAGILVDEARLRGLSARNDPFVATTATGLTQEWNNVVIEIPGTDSRRWPVVLAAHWDASRSTLGDSYLRALSVNDNASGVAAVLEAAAAIARQKHRAPIIAVFLAGGEHDAAGGIALLERLQGKVAAWLELDGVAVPDESPRYRTVYFRGADRLPQVPLAMAQALRSVGLVPRETDEFFPDHTTVAAAESRGIAALAVRTRVFQATDARADLASAAEMEYTSPALITLVAAAAADATLELAGRE